MVADTLTDTERRVVELFRRRYDAPPGGPELIAEVAQLFGITPDKITNKTHTALYVDARALVAWILHGRGWTHAQIGRLLGGRHSATVTLLLKRIDRDRELELLTRELAAA